MKTIRIPRNADFPYIIDSSNTQYVVKKGVRLEADIFDDLLIQESESSSSNTIRIDGSLVSGQNDTAIDLMGSGTKLLIGRHGSVGGDTGVRLSGTNQTFINDGIVYGRVSLGDAENLKAFENSGDIKGGIRMGQSTFELVLGKESMVGGLNAGAGISRSAEDDVATTTVNFGLIRKNVAFSSGDGDETFINRGVLEGDVYLGAGNDTFQSMKRFSSDIYGGEGDDTFILSGSDYPTVFEEVGGGNDTIKARYEVYLDYDSEVETLILIGGSNSAASGSRFDNHIIGNSAKNELAGWGGDDTLEGGLGADRFEMMTEWGNDIVTDFQVGKDRLIVNNWGHILDLDDVQALSTEVDGGVLITQGDDSIFLAGVALAELTARDFLFGWP